MNRIKEFILKYNAPIVGILLLSGVLGMAIYFEMNDIDEPQQKNAIHKVDEINYKDHSYLRIYESDGFSTSRHLIHNPDCECNNIK